MCGQSGRQGEFGRDDLPLLPALRHEVRPDQRMIVHTPEACPRGHARRAHGGFYWAPGLRRHVLYCRRCRDSDASDEWALIDPEYDQHTAEQARGRGLELVVIAPAVAAAPGRIELRVDGQPRSAVEVSLCGQDRTGVLGTVHTDEPYRRLGYGRVLVLAALARGPGYTWSTMTSKELSSTETAAAFLRSLPLSSGEEPRYCQHMLDVRLSGGA